MLGAKAWNGQNAQSPQSKPVQTIDADAWTRMGEGTQTLQVGVRIQFSAKIFEGRPDGGIGSIIVLAIGKASIH